jgi:hypothetical protein
MFFYVDGYAQSGLSPQYVQNQGGYLPVAEAGSTYPA